MKENSNAQVLRELRQVPRRCLQEVMKKVISRFFVLQQKIFLHELYDSHGSV